MMRLFVLAALTAIAVGYLATAGWSSRSLRMGFHSTVSAKLTSAAETPPVASSASGSVRITLNPKTHQACWTFSVTGLRGALTANVLRAAPGKTGPSVIRLGQNYSPKGCTTASARALNGIGNNPTAYYVNIQTKSFLNGAIRGQLR